ncbi:transposase [Ensifer sp. SSB1]|uniref:transposase n=1 Tax=Ensifer sp. SSB1 TaxID=2795385 RepID=UPI000DE3CF5C|nr:transposase [Ensifer sp. SSB1]MBK5571205.1 transposase [Ensifer sp. SSB1]
MRVKNSLWGCRNGRRRFDQSSKDRLVAACPEPGASVSKLARLRGVNANLCSRCIRKLFRGSRHAGCRALERAHAESPVPAGSF